MHCNTMFNLLQTAPINSAPTALSFIFTHVQEDVSYSFL
jgi:hypothetical protein